MLEEKELTIGVSGMLRKNALVMYDRETETLWSSYTGEALAGPMMGKSLEIIESSPRIPFAAWKQAHPDTLVLSVRGQTHKLSNYAGYFSDPNRMGIRSIENLDKRLGGKELVLGVVMNKKSTAVRLETLNKRGIVMAKLDGKDIAIFANVELGLYGAFVVPKGVVIAKVDGRTLLDKDGQSWSAIDGKGTTSNLEMIPALRSFWFAWGDHYPETDLITE